MAVANERLKSFVERLERLGEDKKQIGEDMKLVFAEAKGEGFDTKALRTVLRLRAMDPEERKEWEAIVDLYNDALEGS